LGVVVEWVKPRSLSSRLRPSRSGAQEAHLSYPAVIKNRGILITVFVLFLVSGMTGLAYEIIWTRLLIRLFGATTFAVTTVLASYMGGLALGSYHFP
jgi:hypothetical protein